MQGKRNKINTRIRSAYSLSKDGRYYIVQRSKNYGDLVTCVAGCVSMACARALNTLAAKRESRKHNRSICDFPKPSRNFSQKNNEDLRISVLIFDEDV